MKYLFPVVVPFLCLAVWQASATLGLFDVLFVPAPREVLEALFRGTASGVLLKDLAVTMGRALVAFLLSALVGVPAGLLIGRVSWLGRLLNPTIDFVRSVPATALFPLFLLLFGVGDLAKVAVAVYASSLIVLVNTAYGARQVSESHLRAVRIMGASKFEEFRLVVLPGSLPSIFAGLRLGLSMSLVLVVVTEMFIGTQIGLGYRIVTAQTVYRTAEMFAAIVLAGLAGYLSNQAVLTTEKKYLHWVGRAR